MKVLYLVSTPIGNLEDITIRGLKILFSVEIILCEDTRRTSMLLNELKNRYGKYWDDAPYHREPQLISFYDEVEMQKTPEIIDWLTQGKNIALVCDAGTPLISDPGYKLINEALKRGIKITSIPGPSAALAALTSSGLPLNQFTFLGYLPEKSAHRLTLLGNLLHMNRFMRNTYVFYCAPHKLKTTLEDMLKIFGDINVVIARELTKIHEEIWRGKISETIKYFKNSKGEFVALFHLD